MAGIRPRRATRLAPGWGVQACFVIVVPLLVIPLSLTSLPLALACGVLLLVAVMGPVLGFGRIGGTLVVLGYGTVPLNALHPIGGLGFLELADAFFVIGFLFLVPHFLGSPLRLPSLFVVGSVGLMIIGALSAVASDEPERNFGYLVDLLLGVVVLPVLLVWWGPTHRWIVGAALAYSGGTGINVIKSLLDGPATDGRYEGFTIHPNVMGVCAMLSLALVPYLLAALPVRHHWLAGVVACVSVYAIWISGSRAALLTAALITLLYPLFKRSISAAIAVAALCLPALLVFNHAAQNLDPSNALGRLLGAGSAHGSNLAREEGARAGIEQFLGHPILGDGWLTVWGAHNIYLQIAAAIGLLGLVSFLFLVIPILRPLVAIPAPYGLLAAPGLAALFVGLVDPALGSRYIWSVAALGLCAYGMAARAEPEPAAEKRPSTALAPRYLP